MKSGCSCPIPVNLNCGHVGSSTSWPEDWAQLDLEMLEPEIEDFDSRVPEKIVDVAGESLDKSFALLNGLTFSRTPGGRCLPIPHKCQRIFRLGHVDS